MYRTKTLAAGSALLASVTALTLAGAAIAGSHAQALTVRIEGKSTTLLAARTVALSGGQLTRGGHSCPSDSGAGALNRATKGSWSGSWSTSYSDWEVTKILGETDSYDATKSYWEVFVNDVPASSGICAIKLRAGERILFAAVGANETPGDPLGLKLPSSAQAGKPFTAKVVYYNAKGRAYPLAGATVAFAGRTVKTNARGETPSLTAGAAGTKCCRPTSGATFGPRRHWTSPPPSSRARRTACPASSVRSPSLS